MGKGKSLPAVAFPGQLSHEQHDMAVLGPGNTLYPARLSTAGRSPAVPLSRRGQSCGGSASVTGTELPLSLQPVGQTARASG